MSASICTNIAGSFQCECKPGYDGDGVVCWSLDHIVGMEVIFRYRPALSVRLLLQSPTTDNDPCIFRTRIMPKPLTILMEASLTTCEDHLLRLLLVSACSRTALGQADTWEFPSPSFLNLDI